MKTLMALALAVVVVTTAYALEPESGFDRSLTVSGPVTLSVSTGSGYVHVHAGTDGQVHVVAHMRANEGLNLLSTGVNGEEAMKQIAANPPIHQTGSVISIGPVGNDPLYRNVSIDYDINTPKATALEAHSGSGSVEVADLAQPVSAQSGSGSLQADNIGGKVHLQTGSGSVHAHGIAGDADIQTGSGTIELQQTAPGDVRAHTGSGSIHLDGAKKGLQAQTGSGSITVTGNPSADWKLQTGSGGVHLSLGSAAHFTLDAQAGSGGVQVAQSITMQGALNRHHITGTVNGGGPTLRIQTGSGTIHIE